MKKINLSLSLDKALLSLILIFTAFSLISIAGTHITLGFILVLWIIKMVIQKRWLVKGTGLDLAFGLFLLTFLIATIFSIKPVESIINLKNLLLICVVYIISSNIRREGQIVLVIDIFVFTATIMAALGLLFTDIMGGQRVRALQSTTMTWGAMSTIFMPITASLFLFGKKDKKRWIYLSAFTIQFVSMLFSYVRGSWIGFMTGLIILAVIKSRKVAIVGIILVVCVFIVAPVSIQNRILSITDLSVNSTQVRITQWKNSVRIVKDHPITGVGWIDLNEIHRQYAPEDADLDYHAYQIGHFHNNYIMFLVCFGIIGFGAALYMIYKLFQTEFRIYRRIPPQKQYFSACLLGSIAGMTGFWVNGLFDWTFGDAEPVTLLWFTVGLCVAIGRIVTSQQKIE